MAPFEKKPPQISPIFCETPQRHSANLHGQAKMRRRVAANYGQMRGNTGGNRGGIKGGLPREVRGARQPKRDEDRSPRSVTICRWHRITQTSL